MAETKDNAIMPTGFVQFKKPETSHQKVRDLVISSVIYDKRHGSTWAEEVLGETFNAEFVSRVLTDAKKRKAVVDLLLSDEIGEMFVKAIGKGKHRAGQDVLSKQRVLAAASEMFPSDEDVRLVACEIHNHITRPLSLFDRITIKERIVRVSRHAEYLPSFQDFMTDILARELRTRLDDLEPIVAGDAQFSAEVMADAINQRAHQVARSLRYAAEVRVMMVDVLKIVRAHIDPHLVSKEGGIPLDLIDRAEIAEFAKIYNIVCFAMDDKIVDTMKLSTDYSRLIVHLPQLFTLIRNSERYGQIGLADVAGHFTKTTIRDLDQKPQLSILSHNEIGANSVQAIMTGKPIGGSGQHMISAIGTETYLAGMYGKLMEELASDKIHDMVHRVYDHHVLYGNFKERGLYHLNTHLFATHEEDVVRMLAIATAKRVHLGVTSDKKPVFLYRVDLTGVAYTPTSASRLADEVVLTDPREALHLVPDWKGSKFLADRPQVLPTQAINATVFDPEFAAYAPISKKVVFEQRIGENSFKTSYDLATRGALLDEPSARVVPPMINRRVAAVAWHTIAELLEDAEKIDDPAVKIGVKDRVFGRIMKIVAAMPEKAMEEFIGDIIEQFADGMNYQGGARAVFKSEVTRGIAYRQLHIQALDFFVRRLGLVEDENKGSAIMQKLREDRDFVTFYNGN